MTIPMLPGYRNNQWDFLLHEAIEVDCCAIGIADASSMPEFATRRYHNWISSIGDSTLPYLKRFVAERRDVRHPNILANTQVVVSAAFPFSDGTTQEGVWRYVAAHARARDYHKTIKLLLGRIAQAIKKKYPQSTHRIFVDSAPVMERTWAVLAQIGTIGKSGMLLVPGIGPKVLLGEILVTNVPPPPPNSQAMPLAPSLCENCNRCVSMCPTQAIIGDGTIRPEKCLSYLTIEKRFPAQLSPFEKAFKFIFGCDICQTVCPQSRPSKCSLCPPNEPHIANNLHELIELPTQILQERLAGTSLYRTGAIQIQSIARIMLAHSNQKTKL